MSEERPLPMLAKPWDGRFHGCAVEEKFDGHRMVVRVSTEGVVTAWSRTGKDCEQKLSVTVRNGLSLFFPEGVYDGELVTGDKTGHSYDVSRLENRKGLVFVVFDVLELLGRNTALLPYEKRREFLVEIFKHLHPPQVTLASSTLVDSREQLDAIVQEIWERGGEGVVVKPLDGLYHAGRRTNAYMKIKQCSSAVLQVVGFAPSEGTINNRGLCGMTVLRDDAGIHVVVKTLDDATCRTLEARFDGPSVQGVKIAGRWVHYKADHKDVGRKLRIEYHERTPDGSYRHPRWDRWEEGA